MDFCKQLGCVTLAVCFWTAASAQSSTLTVQVTNVKNIRGKILFALFNRAEGFPETHQKAFRLHEAIPVKGTTTVTFDNLPHGTYALAVFHDENLDAKLNTNFVGIPKEPYGFSNNARPAFSAPGFRDASFVFQRAQAVSIQIK